MTLEWYGVALVFRVFIFIFLFRTNGKKEYLGENEFVTVMVIFRKCHSESYLITSVFKICSQQLRATLTATF